MTEDRQPELDFEWPLNRTLLKAKASARDMYFDFDAQPRGRSAAERATAVRPRLYQTSVCSAISRASSTSIPR